MSDLKYVVGWRSANGRTGKGEPVSKAAADIAVKVANEESGRDVRHWIELAGSQIKPGSKVQVRLPEGAKAPEEVERQLGRVGTVMQFSDDGKCATVLFCLKVLNIPCEWLEYHAN